MSARWRQENDFKYSREHFALDVLDSHANKPDDLTRLVPNPAKARARARRPVSGGQATVDAAVSHLPMGQVRPGSRLHETETKLITHATWMSANNSESALARLLRPHYARNDREGRALLREAFNLPRRPTDHRHTT